MKALVPILALSLAAPALVAAAPANPMATVQAHLRATKSMTADFVQVDRTGKSLGGTLQLQRPGKVRFQYQKGVPLLIVGDGRALFMIDYQVKQVSRWPVSDSPLAVLLNPDKAGQYGRVVPSGDANTLLVAARDPKRPEFGTITIAFRRDASGPGGLVLSGWQTLDAQNNRTTVTLSNQRFNVPVSANAFRWTDPRPRTGPRS